LPLSPTHGLGGFRPAAPSFWGRQGGFACREKAFEGTFGAPGLPASAAWVTARVGANTV